MTFLDMERDVKFFQQQLGGLFDNYISRSDKFLDDNISIFKPSFLLDEKSLQNAFSNEVLFDLTHPIDDVLKEVSAVVEKRARTQAEAVGAYIGTRPSQYSSKMMGVDKENFEISASFNNTGGFEATRLILQERLQRDAKDVMSTHNKTNEAKQLSSTVRTALYQVCIAVVFICLDVCDAYFLLIVTCRLRQCKHYQQRLLGLCSLPKCWT